MTLAHVFIMSLLTIICKNRNNVVGCNCGVAIIPLWLDIIPLYGIYRTGSSFDLLWLNAIYIYNYVLL